MTEIAANVQKVISQYFTARAHHQQLKDQVSDAYKSLKKFEAAVVDAFTETPSTKGGVRPGDGTTVSIKNETQISVTQANEAEVRKWLVEETGDDADFVRENVVKKHVLEFVRDKLAEGVPADEFPEELKINTRPVVSVRGWTSYYAGLQKL